MKHSWLLWAPGVSRVLGCALNALVIAMNNGQMPVLIPGGVQAGLTFDPIHTAMTVSTHLKFLADWILYVGGMYSPGDMFILLCDLILVPCWAAWVAIHCVRDEKSVRQDYWR